MAQMIATSAAALPSAQASAPSPATANAPPTITDAHQAAAAKLIRICSRKADEDANNKKP